MCCRWRSAIFCFEAASAMRAIAIKAADSWSGAAGRPRRARLRRSSSPAHRHDRHERNCLSARSAVGRRAARRRCAFAGGRTPGRGRRRAGAACWKSAAPMPQHLARVAWHIGNRHVPAQVLSNALRIRRDHVLPIWPRSSARDVVEIEAPFDPEGGAYQSGASACSRACLTRARSPAGLREKRGPQPGVSFARE